MLYVQQVTVQHYTTKSVNNFRMEMPSAYPKTVSPASFQSPGKVM